MLISTIATICAISTSKYYAGQAIFAQGATNGKYHHGVLWLLEIDEGSQVHVK